MNNVERIQQKLEEYGLDAILITDEKNQRYALGFPFTDGAVIVARKSAWLITDSRYIEAAQNIAGCCSNVVMYDGSKGLIAHIKDILASEKITRLGAEEEKLSYAEFMRYEHELGVKLENSQIILKTLRAAKHGEEFEALRAAQAISEKALEETLHIIRPGMTEREVAAELVYRMLRHGSEGNSFDPIVITGRKTSMPHGVPGDEVIADGDFVTMDFGCLKYGYCSDMTRTVAVGSATEEMRNIYGIVLKAQLAGIAAARAGIPGMEIDAAARRVITEAGYGEYFGHGFGHSLGLDIHEWPNANPRGKDIMPAGAVVSAEPGIYIPGRYGVRIEDVMILREDGCEVITKAPKEFTVLHNG